MITATFDIRFNFGVDAARLNILLEATVREHHSDEYYVVSDFHIPGHASRSVLPTITIRKQGLLWVHTDSGKATDLSTAVGYTIEAIKRPPGNTPGGPNE
ncbi:MAG TPA: hypothetical protein VL547_11465 [Dinghuibacter sp.]|uniref:hypothetical protein n=1 Tax=Dinghuibacter sp. TaxID=2024697 RepID=UPI002C055A22|nr:hypothetical protein [Dinghuibacter sp.]HTJ12639.1 hypothetical protein [Dinghuibacter sp.]